MTAALLSQTGRLHCVSQFSAGTRVITKNMRQPMYDNACGVIVEKQTPMGEITVKFDDPALGTKAVRATKLRLL